jgi:DNA-binding NarL/FixJ family response regulator
VYAIAIVDAEPIRRAGLEHLVGADPQLKVTASVASVAELGRYGEPSDVVVVDLPAPGHAPALAAVTELATTSRPLVVAAWDESPSLLSTLRAGAYACLSRQSHPAEVLTAVTVVSRGGFYVCSRLRPRLRDEMVGRSREDPANLSRREVETLRLIARGLTQAQIANRMGLTAATINTYAKRIRAKLNATNKAELTRLAARLGYLDDEQPYPSAEPAA